MGLLHLSAGSGARVNRGTRCGRSGGPHAPAVTCWKVDGESGHESRHRLLREVYDAANCGDFDALLEWLHPDIVWVTPPRRITGRNQEAGRRLGCHASAALTNRPVDLI